MCYIQGRATSVPGELQKLLNQHCEDECNTNGRQEHCIGAVARLTPIGSTETWYCYPQSGIRDVADELKCVEDCANTYTCGGFQSTSSLRWGTHTTMSDMVTMDREKWCNSSQDSENSQNSQKSRSLQDLPDSQGSQDSQISQYTPIWRRSEPLAGLQELLDEYCEETCRGSYSETPCEGAVARYSKPFDGTLGWYCYPKTIIDGGEPNAKCVDDCADTFLCDRVIDQYASLHWGNNTAISEMINDNATAWCENQYCAGRTQLSLDAYCRQSLRFLCRADDADCQEGAMARKDFGNSSERTQEWRCYHPDELSALQNTSYCIKGCKAEEAPCSVGVQNGTSTHHWNMQAPLEAIIAQDQLKVGGAGKNVDKLQAQMNAACLAAFGLECSPDASDCKGGPVARKDVYNGQQAWYCWHPTTITTLKRTAICITDCGDEVPCNDSADPEKGKVWTTGVDFEKIKADNLPRTCPLAYSLANRSALQQDLDNFCKDQLKDICQGTLCPGGAVARKDVGTSSERTKQWRCYNPNQLIGKVHTSMCVNNCGEERPCGSGVAGGVSANHWNKTAEIKEFLESQRSKYCR